MKKNMPMFRTTVYLPANVHRAMKMLAAEKGKPMADLLREALVQVYEDELDLKGAEAAMKDWEKNPSSSIDARAYFAKRR